MLSNHHKKINMKSVLTLLFFLGCCKLSLGQFVPYTLYTNSPVLTNAGYPGTNDGQEIWLNYRRSPLADQQSGTVTYWHPLHSKGRGKFGGVSATVMSESWASGLYMVSGAEAGFSYSVRFSSRHALSMGMQAAANMRGVDATKFTTSSQYVLGVFNAELPNGERMSTRKETLYGLHSGLVWYWKDSFGDAKGQLGVSARNINRPEHKLSESRSREIVTYIFTGSIKLWERGRTIIEPSIRYYHYKQSLANIGTLAHYSLSEKVTATAGLWYKTNKSTAAMMQLSNGPLVVACGFDLGAIQNSPGENNNAFEVSLGWRMRRAARREMVPSSATPPMPEELVKVELPAELTKPVVEQPQETKESEPVIAEETVLQEFTDEEMKKISTPIHFSLGESRLTAEAEAFVNELSELINSHPQYSLVIIGHSCTMGGEEINEKISLHRAEEVKSIFVSKGVDEKRITAIGKSYHEPVAPNTTEAGRAQNRRVEITVVSGN